MQFLARPPSNRGLERLEPHPGSRASAQTRRRRPSCSRVPERRDTSPRRRGVRPRPRPRACHLARTNTLRDRNGTGLSTSADALRLSNPETNQGRSRHPTALVHFGAPKPHSAASVSATPAIKARSRSGSSPAGGVSNSAADRERRTASTLSIRWCRHDPSPSSTMRRDARNSEPGGSRRTRAAVTASAEPSPTAPSRGGCAGGSTYR